MSKLMERFLSFVSPTRLWHETLQTPPIPYTIHHGLGIIQMARPHSPGRNPHFKKTHRLRWTRPPISCTRLERDSPNPGLLRSHCHLKTHSCAVHDGAPSAGHPLTPRPSNAASMNFADAPRARELASSTPSFAGQDSGSPKEIRGTSAEQDPSPPAAPDAVMRNCQARSNDGNGDGGLGCMSPRR